MEISSNISDYSDEAKQALEIVVGNKGGYDALTARVQEKNPDIGAYQN